MSDNNDNNDNNKDDNNGLLEKGVNSRIASGVVGFIFLDLVISLSIITSINIFEEKIYVFILLPIMFISIVIGNKLEKNYDKYDNYDKHFSFILFLLIFITAGLVLLANRIFISV